MNAVGIDVSKVKSTAAGANKFLCIYYDRIKNYLASLSEPE